MVILGCFSLIWWNWRYYNFLFDYWSIYDQIKYGSAIRTDRMTKYNQLIRIEEELGDDK